MSKCIPIGPVCVVANRHLLQKFAAEFKRRNLKYGEKTAAYATCVSRLSTKRGLNTKTHLVVDAYGMPLRFLGTDATIADRTVAEKLISGFQVKYLLADRGYNTDAIVSSALQAGIIPVIPPKKNRKVLRGYDKHVYKLRHLVENAFWISRNGEALLRVMLKMLHLLSQRSKLDVSLFGWKFIDDTV